MTTNTKNNYRIGSVKDRVQVCDIETKMCYKIDTTTKVFNRNIDKKLGE